MLKIVHNYVSSVSSMILSKSMNFKTSFDYKNRRSHERSGKPAQYNAKLSLINQSTFSNQIH